MWNRCKDKCWWVWSVFLRETISIVADLKEGRSFEISNKYKSLCVYESDLLSMLAVFSVVISISGSVKYSDATHLPFSDPGGERKKWKRKKDEKKESHKRVARLDLFGWQTVGGLCACRNKTSINKQRGYKNPEKGQTARLRQSDSGDKEI